MVQSENRFTTPMVKKYGKLVPSSWEEAFKTTSDKFKEIQSKIWKHCNWCCFNWSTLTEEFYSLGKFVQIGLKKITTVEIQLYVWQVLLWDINKHLEVMDQLAC